MALREHTNFQVPIVTEYDLLAFHRNHFPNAQDAALMPVYRATEEEVEEYDDGLGYYDDGVKRTLTDDQIAMFRHSEIQRVLRVRELRDEADGDGDITQSLDEDTARQQAVTQRDSSIVANDTRAQAQSSPQSKKRKKPKNNKRKRQQNEEEDWTHRRIAREQDEVQAENVELDY